MIREIRTRWRRMSRPDKGTVLIACGMAWTIVIAVMFAIAGS